MFEQNTPSREPRENGDSFPWGCWAPCQRCLKEIIPWFTGELAPLCCVGVTQCRTLDSAGTGSRAMGLTGHRRGQVFCLGTWRGMPSVTERAQSRAKVDVGSRPCHRGHILPDTKDPAVRSKRRTICEEVVGPWDMLSGVFFNLYSV